MTLSFFALSGNFACQIPPAVFILQHIIERSVLPEDSFRFLDNPQGVIGDFVA